jgi:hypothetical protein
MGTGSPKHKLAGAELLGRRLPGVELSGCGLTSVAMTRLGELSGGTG